jgi:hypothetical protein
MSGADELPDRTHPAQEKRSMTRLRPAITSIVLVSLATALLGIPSVALAQDQPSLAVPDAGSRDADRALVTNDGPRIRPDEFDVDAAGEAALDQVDLFVDADWDLAVLADELGSEPEAAFVLVRDRIAFDPYAGVLRDARGTLSARAGNS